MTTNRQGIFSDKDRKVLDATSKSTWIPPDPVDLIIPYLENKSIEDESDTDKRRRKTREVYEGYANLESDCREMRDKIAERCKNIKIMISEDKNKVVFDAASRLFRREVKEITFEMYMQIVHGIEQLGKNSIPRII
jgi:hypothetical protein